MLTTSFFLSSVLALLVLERAEPLINYCLPTTEVALIVFAHLWLTIHTKSTTSRRGEVLCSPSSKHHFFSWMDNRWNAYVTIKYYLRFFPRFSHKTHYPSRKHSKHLPAHCSKKIISFCHTWYSKCYQGGSFFSHSQHESFLLIA